MNLTTMNSTTFDTNIVQQTIHLVNFILSCTGVGFNLLLIIILFVVGRRHCTTYFLLILMAICDLLYCTVYVSIVLTLDQYLNIINHQIMCPLSFFLTPFAFTGSALLLLICLLHLLTNYVRKYDTVLGQISGRLSVVFVLSFTIIRSVPSTTSVELVTMNSPVSQIQYCTVDMNPPELVETFQKLNYIFSEVTDILVYIGWILILLIYLIKFLPRGKFPSCEQPDMNQLPMNKLLSFTSLVVLDNAATSVANEPGAVELCSLTNPMPEEPIITSKEKHRDVSLIVVSLSFLSILLYLPVIINKYSTMYFFYSKHPLLNDVQTKFLQMIQQTSLLFCLSIRCLPYLIFDKRIHSIFNQMIGMKCTKIEQRKARLRQGRSKLRSKYRFHCQCYRRQQVLEFDYETNHHSDNC